MGGIASESNPLLGVHPLTAVRCRSDFEGGTHNGLRQLKRAESADAYNWRQR